MSKRESELLNLLVKFIDNSGFPPSLRELSSLAQYNSTNYTRQLLDKLKQRGYVKRQEYKARTITITAEGHIASRESRGKVEQGQERKTTTA